MSYLRHIWQHILPRLGLVFFIMLLVPSVASAHEKWFTDGSKYPPQFRLLFTLPVLGMIGPPATGASLPCCCEQAWASLSSS